MLQETRGGRELLSNLAVFSESECCQIAIWGMDDFALRTWLAMNSKLSPLVFSFGMEEVFDGLQTYFKGSVFGDRGSVLEIRDSIDFVDEAGLPLMLANRINAFDLLNEENPVRYIPMMEFFNKVVNPRLDPGGASCWMMFFAMLPDWHGSVEELMNCCFSLSRVYS